MIRVNYQFMIKNINNISNRVARLLVVRVIGVVDIFIEKLLKIYKLPIPTLVLESVLGKK